MIELQTERLRIRGFLADDWKDLYDYLSDKQVIKYEPYDAFTEEESRREAMKRSKDENFYAVCLKDTDKVIGNLYFSEQEFGTWELGYVFNANYQGKGYASEAAAALLEDAFRNRGVRRVIAMCNPENAASWRLLERLGMRREGHLLQNIFFRKDEQGNPIWQDTYEYAILSDEWNKSN
jgi:RimJ/RimL family protein N-acetyltransferase